MSSAVLITILLMLVIVTLMSVLYTVYVVCLRHASRRTGRTLPWSTLGIASRQSGETVDVAAMPRRPAPSHPGLGSHHGRSGSTTSSMRVAYQQRDGSWAFAGPLDPFAPSLLASSRSLTPTPSLTRYHEKKLSELGSLELNTDIALPPPSYSQVEGSPLSPRYSLVAHDQLDFSDTPYASPPPPSPPVAYSQIDRSPLVEPTSLPTLPVGIWRLSLTGHSMV